MMSWQSLRLGQPGRLARISSLPHAYFGWAASGVGLVILHAALLCLSSSFDTNQDLRTQPIGLLVGLEVLAGALYLFVIWKIGNTPSKKHLLVWALGIGLVLRIALFLSTPMLEDDYHRYLWDGAVTAEGFNPYAYAPAHILEAMQPTGSLPPGLRQLAGASGEVLPGINYADIRTVYPPVAEATFALAHWLKPWNLFSWRFILFGFDLATLGLLIGLLRTLNLPLIGMVIYWWNPVLVKEIYNSAHMDVIALPFVLGAVLLATRGKHIAAAGSLALAIGAKIWPLVLLPLLFRPVLTQPRKLIPALATLALLCWVLFLPVFAVGMDAGSGWLAYGQRWEMNDGLFMLILWGAQSILKVTGGQLMHSQLVARVAVGAILVVWIVWLSRRRIEGPADLCLKCLFVVAGLFLLSPTQFPWYYIWLLPFLALQPRWSLLLLTMLLPLYYIRFTFVAHDHTAVFDYGIVWLEYVPVWYLLIREWTNKRRSLSPFLVKNGLT